MSNKLKVSIITLLLTVIISFVIYSFTELTVTHEQEIMSKDIIKSIIEGIKEML